MPLYTYRCQDCQAILELLIKNVNLEPSRCGLHCVLYNLRIMMTYVDLVSYNVLSETSVVLESTPFRMLPSTGLSTYKKDCDGNYRKVSGKEGPEI